jgi:hypothetical protein
LSWRCASSPNFVYCHIWLWSQMYTAHVFQQRIDVIWMKYFSLNFSFVLLAAGPTRWEYRQSAVLEMSFGMSEFRAIVWRSFPCHIPLMSLSIVNYC